MGCTKPQQLLSYNLKVIKQYMKAAQYMGQKRRRKEKKEGKTKPVKKDQSASFCRAGAIFAHHMTKSSVQIIEHFLRGNFFLIH